MADLESLEREVAGLREAIARLRAEIGRVFLGQEGVVEELLLGLLARGHILLEGVPGLGKTTLVRCLARCLDLGFRRIQFTPDLMPADILGMRILEEAEDGRRSFEFEPGPIFSQVVLADEINRATPRTQSALLEAMQEGSVTLHGETRPLGDPFFLIATQNPIELEGTYPLPEAQLDRFLLEVNIELPGLEELVAILEATTGPGSGALEAMLGREDVLRLRALVREVPVSSELTRLVGRLVLATHPGGPGAPERVRSLVRFGSSPRGGQAVLLAARARALLRGRLHVSVEDVEAVARPALRHRLILGFEGEAAGVRPDELIDETLAAVRGGE